MKSRIAYLGFLLALAASPALAGLPGTQKWAYDLKTYCCSSPALAPDGTVYLGNYDGFLTAIKPDGTRKWEAYLAGEHVYCSPAIGADGTIYIGDDSYKLYAVDPALGYVKKSHTTGYVVHSTPAIGADGTVYFGSNDGYLHAVDKDLNFKWRFPAGGVVDSSPAIGPDGTIYVGSADQKLYAVRPDGSKKWEFPASTGWELFGYSSPAIGLDGTIYVGCNQRGYAETGGVFYAVRPDGSKKWQLPIRSYNSPVIGGDGTIYVTAWNSLVALNPNGTQKWAWELPEERHIEVAPTIGADGTIYVGGSNSNLPGKLYALNPDKSVKWTFTTNHWSVDTHPAIGPDGTVYVADHGGMVYAIYSASRGLANSAWPMFHHDVQHTGRFAAPPPPPGKGITTLLNLILDD